MAKPGFWARVTRLASHVLRHAVFFEELPYCFAHQATLVALVREKPKNRKRKKMNNFSKVAVVTAALALVAQGAKAGNPNDLILGLSDTAATQDYVIDLGQVSGFIGDTSVKDLSGDLTTSTFNSDFSSTLSTLTAGVVGGTSASTGNSYITTVRASAGTPSSANSLTPPATSIANGGSMSSATAKAIGNNAEGITLGSSANNVTGSWTVSEIGFAQTQASFNPNTTISGTVYEDLWQTKNSNAGTESYLGYFTFNFSGSTPVVTWTSAAVAVPEPATYGCLAGAGLLVVALRRQLGQKVA